MIFDGGMRFDGTPAQPELRLKFAGGRCFGKHQRNEAGHAYMDRFNGVAVFFPDVETYPKGGYMPGEDVPDGPIQAENKDSRPGQEGIMDQPSGETAPGAGSAGGPEVGSEPDQLSPEQPQPADEAGREVGEGVRGDAQGVAVDPIDGAGDSGQPEDQAAPTTSEEPSAPDPTTADSSSESSTPTETTSDGSSQSSTTDVETLL